MDNQPFHSRLAKLRNHMNNEEIDLLIITSPVNIFYFTGFYSNPHERIMALVIDAERKDEYLFVPLLDFDTAKNASFIQNIVTISDSEDPYQVFASTVSKDASMIGVEKRELSLFQYEQLVSKFPKSNWTDLESFITSLRINKTPDEITKIRSAIHMIEEVMEAGRKVAKVGITELDLLAELEYHMRKIGSDGPSFDPIVLTGKRASLPHGTPGRVAIENNDFLLIDMGVRTEGYCSDITRTFLVGEGTKEQEKIYNIVLEANQKAIEAVQVGESLGKIDIAAREWIKNSGYGDYFNNRVGHGMGMEVHEAPSVHELNTDLVAPGMVFTIEPGIYIPEIGGVRIEDNVYVNENGEVEVLTRYPRELIRI
ncbi:Xaa-Pro peptidase family protein [Radiobacillus kanasensis]|uniref:M24 family metallopeptidase n=1 Tax=Radiobacillus kanasensis TaxID=2844358 RepID=UPI001E2BFA18|nr:Xaa-Pro peptidase family protein [Radiobacillus kanasensis]UFT98819.1 Xaa-Pro peptidase family protein [Radiobacillus kanasensis]